MTMHLVITVSCWCCAFGAGPVMALTIVNEFHETRWSAYANTSLLVPQQTDLLFHFHVFGKLMQEFVSAC